MAAMSSGYRVRAALLTVVLALFAGCGGSGDGDNGGSTNAATGTATTAAGGGVQLGPASGAISALPGALKSAPPWPANNGPSLQLRLRKIGLEPLREEGQVVHIHQHLDLYVNGQPVTVPAQIGIDAGGGFISDLHTHETDGILHVESPTQRSFTLGQFFAVWSLPLNAGCIGSLCENGDRQLRVWVNGQEVAADPTRIVLAEHQEIVIAYGSREQVPDPVPKSFDFASVGL
jgi:hypothetical protein